MLLKQISLLIAGLAISTQAFANQTYSCLPIGDDDIQDDVTLTVLSGGRAIYLGQDPGTIDDGYDPRLNEGFQRFDLQSNDEGSSEVLIQDKLLSGGKQGFIKLQNRGEGFYSQKLHCVNARK